VERDAADRRIKLLSSKVVRGEHIMVLRDETTCDEYMAVIGTGVVALK
jgi:hypothetical protein